MTQLYANGMTMSQILGFSKPIEERGQVLSNGQMPDQVRHDVLVGGKGQAKADLSIPAQVNTSFVPYITSVGKQCLQPMAYGIKLIAVLIFICCLFNNAALAQSHENGGAVDGVGEIRPLEIGDTIPEAIWATSLELEYFDGRKETIRLGDLRGKIILLDYWATTCPGCITGIPKMEYIQQKYQDDVSVLLVNSKRNRDTPERIKNSFKIYEENNAKLPHLPTILDDTLFTGLFPHNTIPAVTWINKEGVFLGTTLSNEVMDSNIESILRYGTASLVHHGTFKNLSRQDVPPLVDTTGMMYISAFSPQVGGYLSAYPNIRRTNGHTLYQPANQGLSMMVKKAFRDELRQLDKSAYLFDPSLDNALRFKLWNPVHPKNIYWYQLFSRDSLTTDEVNRIFRKDISQQFGFTVKRNRGEIEVYRVTLGSDTSRIVVDGGISMMGIGDADNEVIFKNAWLDVVLKDLVFLLDKPIIVEDIPKVKVDITFPQGFVEYPIEQKLAFLEKHGISLYPIRKVMDYALFSPSAN